MADLVIAKMLLRRTLRCLLTQPFPSPLAEVGEEEEARMGGGGLWGKSCGLQSGGWGGRMERLFGGSLPLERGPWGGWGVGGGTCCWMVVPGVLGLWGGSLPLEGGPWKTMTNSRVPWICRCQTQ